MCGIAGFHIKKGMRIRDNVAVEALVNELLLGIEWRGKHATGFVAVTKDGKTVMDKDAIEASEFIKDRDKIPEDPRTVLLHTRYWTKGDPKDHRNNHPVLAGSCFAIHNGQIRNDDELFESTKLVRNADVDSIIIPTMVDKLGFDKIKEAAEQWEGSFATAIINPVKNPGELLLVRGNATSPLVIVSNDNWVIWASTEKAIKDAWTKVFGTPPDSKRFETVPEGTILHFDKEGKQTTEKFTVKKKPFTNAGASGSTSGTNGTTGPGYRGYGYYENPALKENRKELQAFVNSGEGTARRHRNKTKLTKSGKLSGVVVWELCDGCQESVVKADKVHTRWGFLCWDCKGVMQVIADRKAEALRVAGETGTVLFDSALGGLVCAGTKIPRIDAADRDALEQWGAAETEITKQVVEEMSKHVGSFYSTQLIFFLLFLAGEAYSSQAGNKIKQLISELSELYDDVLLGMMEQGDLDNPEVPETPRAGSEDTEAAFDWCDTHNRTYTKGRECPQCDFEDQAIEDFARQVSGEGGAAAAIELCGVEITCDGEPVERAASKELVTRSSSELEFSRCPVCDTVVLINGGHCAVCAHNKAQGLATIEGYPMPAERISDTCRNEACGAYRVPNSFYCEDHKPFKANVATVHPIDQGVKCGTCQRKTTAKYILTTPGIGTKLGFCGRHYDKCHAVGCKASANHLEGTTKRFCHAHSRSKSGLVSDKTLAKRGYTLSEVIR